MQGMDGRPGSSPVIRHSFEMVLVNQHNLLREIEPQTFIKAICQAYGVGTMEKEAGLFARPLDSLVGPPGFEPRTQGL